MPLKLADLLAKLYALHLILLIIVNKYFIGLLLPCLFFAEILAPFSSNNLTNSLIEFEKKLYRKIYNISFK